MFCWMVFKHKHNIKFQFCMFQKIPGLCMFRFQTLWYVCTSVLCDFDIKHRSIQLKQLKSPIDKIAICQNNVLNTTTELSFYPWVAVIYDPHIYCCGILFVLSKVRHPDTPVWICMVDNLTSNPRETSMATLVYSDPDCERSWQEN